MERGYHYLNHMLKEEYETHTEISKYNFVCITCGKKHITRYALYAHVQKNHSQVSQLLYTCRNCAKTYRSHNANFIQMHLLRCQSNARDQNFKCAHCGKEYKHRLHLIQHINKSHTKINCEVCGEMFNSRSTLIQHIHKKHIQRIEEVKFYECAHCDNKYNQRSHIVRHLRKVHKKKNNFKCVNCSQTFRTGHKLYLHFCRSHASEDDFECAICSQKYHSHKKLMQHLNTSHTIKKALSYEFNMDGDNNKFLVQVITGTINLESTSQTADEKKSVIAKVNGEKIAQSVPDTAETSDAAAPKTPTTNQEATASVPSEPETCIEEVTAIARDYENDSNADEKEYKVSKPKSWIFQTNEDIILYCKEPNSYDAKYPHLDYEEFILITMNAEQEENLKRYGNDVILVDRTDDFNSYEFEMTAIMVLDQFRQGIATTFMFSNRADEYTYQILFAELQKKVNQLTPKVFMSDKTDFYYSAWEKVMGRPQKRLFCTWYVSQDWKENLSKVEGDNGKKTSVYARLREMQTEMKCSKFHSLLEAFLNEEDADLKEFLKYFETFYTHTFASWAYCYRRYSGINTNTYTKQLFSKIRKKYLSRVDYTKLQDDLEIIQVILENFFYEESIRKLKQERVIEKVEELVQRHEESIKENLSSIREVPSGWCVPPDKNRNKVKDMDDMYLVQPYVQNCDCQLRCVPCNACIHKYQCSCVDYSVEYNFCKHIHLVCQLMKEKAKNETDVIIFNDVPKAEPFTEYAPEAKIRKQENGVMVNGLKLCRNLLDKQCGTVIRSASTQQPVNSASIPCAVKNEDISYENKDMLQQFKECIRVFDIDMLEQPKKEYYSLPENGDTQNGLYYRDSET